MDSPELLLKLRALLDNYLTHCLRERRERMRERIVRTLNKLDDNTRKRVEATIKHFLDNPTPTLLYTIHRALAVECRRKSVWCSNRLEAQ